MRGVQLNHVTGRRVLSTLRTLRRPIVGGSRVTLTRILPTLRRSIPDPITPDRWPERTRATIGDVEVAGVSLLRIADLCGTPAVHIAHASVPGSNGTVASPAMPAGVVVVRVVEASEPDDGTVRNLIVDAELNELEPVWSEARLIGRVSVARAVPTALGSTSADPSSAPTADLPADLTIGDLIALPYAAVTDDADVARPASGWLASAALTRGGDGVSAR